MSNERASGKRPRVAIILPSLAPYRIDTLNLLAKECSLKVFFLGKLPASSRGWTEWGLISGVTFEYQVVPSLLLRFSYWYYWQISPLLIWYLRQFNPDVVVAYDFNVNTLAVCWYAKNWRKKLIISTELTAESAVTLGSWRKPVRQGITKLADALIGTSQASVSYLVSLGVPRERCFKSIYGVDLSTWRKKLSSVGIGQVEGIRKRLGKRRTLLNVARLVPEKGHFYLLKAFKQVRSVTKDVGLLLVGDGPMRSHLQNFARAEGLDDCIVFFGGADYPQMAAFYSVADAFVFPTLWDPFGFVVVESLASGLPVIVSPFAGASELIVEDVNGYVIDPTRIYSLAEKIIGVLTDEANLVRLRRGARITADNVSVEKSVHDYMAAIRYVLG